MTLDEKIELVVKETGLKRSFVKRNTRFIDALIARLKQLSLCDKKRLAASIILLMPGLTAGQVKSITSRNYSVEKDTSLSREEHTKRLVNAWLRHSCTEYDEIRSVIGRPAAYAVCNAMTTVVLRHLLNGGRMKDALPEVRQIRQKYSLTRS